MVKGRNFNDWIKIKKKIVILPHHDKMKNKRKKKKKMIQAVKLLMESGTETERLIKLMNFSFYQSVPYQLC